MSIKYLPLLFIILLLFSCKQEITYTNTPVDFSIVSPKPSWTYYDDTQIMLAVNVNTMDVVWTSDVSGYLGEGNHITVFLPQGLQRIKAEIQKVKKEMYIYVAPNAKNVYSRSVLLNYTPLEVKIKEGIYGSFLYTHEGSVNDFWISGIQSPLNDNRLRYSRNGISEPLNRDIRLPMPQTGKFKDIKKARYISGNMFSSEQKRTFFVANTLHQYATPHHIEASLFYQSDTLAVWISDFDNIPDDILTGCIQTVETLIIPRVEALWGKPADIDGDGRMAVLFTHTINEENSAVGFFNPSDFFETSDNISNEMDIIYIAMPDSAPGSAYSAKNIIATVAHELTHACTFTAKTWKKLKNGSSNAEREDLFLDEGWSHLTENICGVGISGGNVKFLNRFLENTSMYSLCGANRYGQEDSPGMRGAITLFLSWLFWKSGGITWDDSDPVTIKDSGGIAFLERMVELSDTGWESIGTAYGRPIHTLFNEMLEEINYCRMTNNTYNSIIDPATKETVNFFVNMGDITIIGSSDTINVGLPNTVALNSFNTLPQWSFIFFDNISVPSDSLLTLYASKNNGRIFYAYSPWRTME